MFIKSFQNLSRKDVSIAGGKGASLGEMTRAGIPVPPGLVVLAGAYDWFLDETDLREDIEAQLEKIKYSDINSVERASAVIRDLLHDAEIPKDIESEIIGEYKKLGSGLVAVRSSATAEDSQVASWAGELESYLNTSEKMLLENVKKCWSSLFTPRAIFYRREKNLHKKHIGVAVVVQKMIQAEVSGICFTVHPVTEDRNQMVIEAGWGLGEAVVGGLITPDSYVVRKIKTSAKGGSASGGKSEKLKSDFKIEDKNISEQKMMIARSAKGTKKVKVPENKAKKQKLKDGEILKLAALCQKIEKHYGCPQDIEWAMEKGKIYIVQSRPITTLK